MDCLNIDFIGPFPDKGHILVVVCTFTRWVELYATVDATSQTTAECLLQHFGRFGAPRQLRSDRAPPTCECANDYKDIPFVWERTNEVYIQTIHR